MENIQKKAGCLVNFCQHLICISLFALLPAAVFSNNGSGDDTTAADVMSTEVFISAIDNSITQFGNEAIMDFFDSKFAANFSDSVITSPDLVYEFRIAELDNKTPINLDYNEQVKKYIDYFLQKRPDMISKMLGLSQLYFPMFEEAFDKYDLPLELKYLAVVESALNPRARSRSGAVGLWQFMLSTGKLFDLEVNSYVDDRQDPQKSTDAACKYLEYLYRTFNDWQLAIAAYNGGPGCVRNAILRSGGKTSFWEIQPYLPLQTKNYVPAFIAINYVMSYASQHNVKAVDPKLFWFQTDTVLVDYPVVFSQVAAFTKIPEETISYLNPAFKKNYIPRSSSPVPLVLPSSKISKYIEFEKDISGYSSSMNDATISGTGSTADRVKISHVVQKGDFCHKLAIDYRCSVEDIVKWNNLTSMSLSSGQQLSIWVPQEMAADLNTKKQKQMVLSENLQQQSGFYYYTVQNGDTLSGIASKFKLKSDAELKQMNNITDASELKPGQQLKVALAY